MGKRPIWDSSNPAKVRYVAVEDIPPYISKGSVFEINEQVGDIRPAYCTVHMVGTMMKLYLTEAMLHHLNPSLVLMDEADQPLTQGGER